MEKNYHAVKQRLENIKTIKPLLMSLRTISLSSWKVSLKKLSILDSYMQDMDIMLHTILTKDQQMPGNAGKEKTMLVFGSSRGLCGSFNRSLFEYLENYQRNNPATEIKYILFGEKVNKLFLKNKIIADKLLTYPKISHLNFEFVTSMVEQIVENGTYPVILLLYNAYMGTSKYKPRIQEISLADTSIKSLEDLDQKNIIVDTDERDLFMYIQKHDYLISIYKAFLSSFAAEHSSRFQIMENSLNNTDKLIQEMTITVQVERQRKVTSEMRELSISAGLLNKN